MKALEISLLMRLQEGEFWGMGSHTQSKATCGSVFSRRPFVDYGYFCIKLVLTQFAVLEKGCKTQNIDSLRKHCHWKKGSPVSSTLRGSFPPLCCCHPFVDAAASTAPCPLGRDMGLGPGPLLGLLPSLAHGVITQTCEAYKAASEQLGTSESLFWLKEFLKLQTWRWATRCDRCEGWSNPEKTPRNIRGTYPSEVNKYHNVRLSSMLLDNMCVKGKSYSGRSPVYH